MKTLLALSPLAIVMLCIIAWSIDGVGLTGTLSFLLALGLGLGAFLLR